MRHRAILFLVLAYAPCTNAEPFLERNPAPRLVDQFGDPLPTGAIARLGSTRLRHPGLIDFTLLADGKSVVSIGADRQVRWWDLETGRLIRLKQFDTGKLRAISADGQWVAIDEERRDNDNTKPHIAIRDSSTGEELQRIQVDRPPFFVRFSHDKSTLDYSEATNTVQQFNLKESKHQSFAIAGPIRGSFHSSEPYLQFSYARNAKRFAAWPGLFTEGVNRLVVFDTKRDADVLSVPGRPEAAALSSDGTRLYVWGGEPDSRDDALRRFDLNTGKLTGRTPLKAPHRESRAISFPSCHGLTVSPDGKVLAFIASGRCYLFEIASGRLLHRFSASIYNVQFSADGHRVAGNEGARIRVWDVSSGREIGGDRSGQFGSPTAISADGRTIAVADSLSATVSLWDATTGVRQRIWDDKIGGGIDTLSFDSNGRFLIGCDHYNQVRMWDGRGTSWDDRQTEARRPLPLPDSHHPNYSEPKTWMHISPDGRKVAAILPSIDDRRHDPYYLVIWCAETGNRLIRREMENAIQCEWSPDGRFIVAQGLQETCCIDASNGRLLYKLEDRGKLAFSADGRLCVSNWLADRGSKTSSALFRELLTGLDVADEWLGPRQLTGLVVLGPLRALVTADDEYLRVFDIATQAERGRLKSQTLAGPVGSMRSFPDGRRVLTTHADGTALVWDLSEFAPPKLSDRHGEPQLKQWWADLAAEDARVAWLAIWKMSESPTHEVVAFLRKRMRPVTVPNVQIVAGLINDLSSDAFATREAAAIKLFEFGRPVLPAIKRGLSTSTSSERSERLEKLIDRLNAPIPPPSILQQLRAQAVLEAIGTPAARTLLTELSRGEPDAHETKSAALAVERIELLATVAR